jgi:hypothetical protein
MPALMTLAAPDGKPLLTLEQFAEAVGCDKTTVRNCVKLGKLQRADFDVLGEKREVNWRFTQTTADQFALLWRSRHDLHTLKKAAEAFGIQRLLLRVATGARSTSRGRRPAKPGRRANAILTDVVALLATIVPDLFSDGKLLHETVERPSGEKKRVVVSNSTMDRLKKAIVSALNQGRRIDREKFKTTAEIVQALGLTQRGELQEVRECIALWRDSLSPVTILVEWPGKLRGKQVKRLRAKTLYDFDTFKERWAAPFLDAAVEQLRTMTVDGKRPLAAAVHETMKSAGVVGVRLARALKKANLRSVQALDGKNHCVYERAQGNPLQRPDAGQVLRDIMVEGRAISGRGAVPANWGFAKAKEKQVTARRVRIAMAAERITTLNLDAGESRVHSGFLYSWCESGEEPLSVKEHEKFGAADSVANAPPAAEQLNPSRRKQQWCFERYVAKKPDGTWARKLQQILEEGKREFGALAPKSEGDLITYAKRWARYKNISFPKRN